MTKIRAALHALLDRHVPLMAGEMSTLDLLDRPLPEVAPVRVEVAA